MALTAVALLIAIPAQMIFVTTVRARESSTAIAEIRGFIRSHPGSLPAIGYAGTSHLSYLRPEVVFRSGEYLLNAPAIQEHGLAGLPLPASTIRAIAACQVAVWLIPSGAGAPFAVPSAYAPRGPLMVFSDAFRRAFTEHYQRTASTGSFDVWTCRR